jgi:RNA polymerase sigma-70 factor (ECF subfamily)
MLSETLPHCKSKSYQRHVLGIVADVQTLDTRVASTQEIDAFLASAERRAFKHAVFAVQDHHSALDIVQNAMLKLVERYGDKPAEELPLLFQRILQNAIHDHFRRAKVRDFWVRLVSPIRDKDEDTGETLESLSAASTSERVPSPEEQLSGAQSIEAIEKALSELPARQREAFLLRYWEELDVAETAKVMGCSEGSVKTHCFRAVNALAAILKGKGVHL